MENVITLQITMFALILVGLLAKKNKAGITGGAEKYYRFGDLYRPAL